MGGLGKKIISAIPFVIFGVDGLIKRRVDRTMEPDEIKTVCGGRLILKKRYNEGAALGLLSDQPKMIKTMQGALLSIAAVCFAVMLPKKGRTGFQISMGMLLGGGMSNFYDRLRKGHVVDYASVPVRCGWLRRIVFNLSDVCILMGAFILVLFGRKRK